MKKAVKKKHARGRPARGSGIAKQDIVKEALAQIDKHGLAEFSVRDVAAKLGVYPASIYWHVASKDGLLAEVANLVMADVAPTNAQLSWQEWMTDLFRRCRAAVRLHPNTAQLIGAQMVSNACLSTNLIEAILKVLQSMGFQGSDLLEAYNCVISSMLGFITMEFAPLPSENREEWAAQLEARVRAIPALDYPALASVLSQFANKAFILRWSNGVAVPLDASFDRYVAVFIAGLAAFAELARDNKASAVKPARK